MPEIFDIYIENKNKIDTKALVSKIDDFSERKKAFAYLTGLNLLSEYLCKTGVSVLSENNEYLNLLLFRDNHTASIITENNIKITAITVTEDDGAEIGIPMNSRADIYVAIRSENNLSKAGILGFIEAEQLQAQENNNEYIISTIDNLRPVEELGHVIQNSADKTPCFGEDDHQTARNLLFKYSEDRISTSDKEFFIGHVFLCAECGNEFNQIIKLNDLIKNSKQEFSFLNFEEKNMCVSELFTEDAESFWEETKINEINAEINAEEHFEDFEHIPESKREVFEEINDEKYTQDNVRHVSNVVRENFKRTNAKRRLVKAVKSEKKLYSVSSVVLRNEEVFGQITQNIEGFSENISSVSENIEEENEKQFFLEKEFTEQNKDFEETLLPDEKEEDFTQFFDDDSENLLNEGHDEKLIDFSDDNSENLLPDEKEKEKDFTQFSDDDDEFFLNNEKESESFFENEEEEEEEEKKEIELPFSEDNVVSDIDSLLASLDTVEVVDSYDIADFGEESEEKEEKSAEVNLSSECEEIKSKEINLEDIFDFSEPEIEKPEEKQAEAGIDVIENPYKEEFDVPAEKSDEETEETEQNKEPELSELSEESESNESNEKIKSDSGEPEYENIEELAEESSETQNKFILLKDKILQSDFVRSDKAKIASGVTAASIAVAVAVSLWMNNNREVPLLKTNQDVPKTSAYIPENLKNNDDRPTEKKIEPVHLFDKKDLKRSGRPKKDLNAVLAEAYTRRTYEVDIRNISWEIPVDMAENKVFKNYIMVTGQVLKSALARDLAVAEGKAVNNKVEIKSVMDLNGNIKEAEIVRSSGSQEIDNICLDTYKTTLMFTKLPKIETERKKIKTGIIISF